MSKGTGKFLLFTAAVSAACAGAYYYFKTKNEADAITGEYNDFGTPDKKGDRSYTTISDSDTTSSDSDTTSANEDPNSVPQELADAVADVKDTEVSVEEFFDDEDEVEDAEA